MKRGTDKLVNDLRNEHNTLVGKIGSAEFAIATLDLDETEKELMWGQISLMKQQCEQLRKRAKYAIEKEQKLESQKVMELKDYCKSALKRALDGCE